MHPKLDREELRRFYDERGVTVRSLDTDTLAECAKRHKSRKVTNKVYGRRRASVRKLDKPRNTSVLLEYEVRRSLKRKNRIMGDTVARKTPRVALARHAKVMGECW